MNRRELKKLREQLGQLAGALSVALVSYKWTKKQRVALGKQIGACQVLTDAIDGRDIGPGTED
jgi:hypothetical protein